MISVVIGFSAQARDPRSQPGPGRTQPAADPRRKRPPDKPSPKPEPVPEIDSYDTENTFDWRLIIVEKKPLKLPDSVLNDPGLKDDPRLKKYKQRLAGGTSPSKGSDTREIKKEPTSPDRPGIQSPDSKAPKTSPSFPVVSEKTGLPTLPPLPGLENFTVPKPTDPRLSRQLSEKKKEETSPAAHKDFKPLAHRNDPRFRKKSKSTDTPPQDKDKEQVSPDKPVKKEDEKPPPTMSDKRARVSAQRRDNLEYSSPLASGNSPSGNKSPSYKPNKSTGNNRTKNKLDKEAPKRTSTARIQQDEVDSDKPSGSPGPLDPDMPILTPILPEQIDSEPVVGADERSLKDTFSTLDPTASPFC